jgi:copper resistance protein C
VVGTGRESAPVKKQHLRRVALPRPHASTVETSRKLLALWRVKIPNILRQPLLPWAIFLASGPALMVGLLCGPAGAHAFLEKASPAVGSILPSSPATLTLAFSEPIEPLFSSVQLLRPQGSGVPIGKPSVKQGGRALTIALPKLLPGRYTVVWHVTSVDTHKTEGRFTFTVAP